jgi:hypothetical protein
MSRRRGRPVPGQGVYFVLRQLTSFLGGSGLATAGAAGRGRHLIRERGVRRSGSKTAEVNKNGDLIDPGGRKGGVN